MFIVSLLVCSEIIFIGIQIVCTLFFPLRPLHQNVRRMETHLPAEMELLKAITLKGGYLDFSHLTELKNIYISLKFI